MSISVVQTTSAKGDPSTGVFLTLTGVSAANYLLLAVSAGFPPSAVPSGFTQLYAPTLPGSGTGTTFYGNAAPTAGTNSVSVNWAVAEYSFSSLTEISGLAASPLDAMNYTNGATVQSSSVASGTLAQASEIVIAVLTYAVVDGSDPSAAITDPPTGFTSIAASQRTLFEEAGEHCYQIVSSTGSVTASWTWVDTPITDSQSAIISLAGASTAVLNTGSAVLDFGAGSNEAQVAVSGAANILSTSTVKAFIMADDTTLDHSSQDHRYVGLWLDVTVQTPTAGVGFTIVGRAKERLAGKFKARWRVY